MKEVETVKYFLLSLNTLLPAHSKYSLYLKREWDKSYKLTEKDNILPHLIYPQICPFVRQIQHWGYVAGSFNQQL